MIKKSRILREVLETARDMRDSGLITAKTMRKFQTLCRERVSSKSRSTRSKRVR